jgi:hypothetical protein
MAKTNYNFEKRQRELARKKKQDEKRRRKQEKSEAVPGAPETVPLPPPAENE